MVVEDLDDLGVLDADHALRLLGVVDEQDATRLGVDEVGAGDEADRAPAASYSFTSRCTMSSAGTLVRSDVVSNISRPKAVASIARTCSR